MACIAADRLDLKIPVEVLDLELKREGKSYTSDTLRGAARNSIPETELWLLMGTDMFLTLQNWHEPKTIMKLAGICAFGRTESDGEELFAPQRDYLACGVRGCRCTTITLPGLVDISSTQLRDAPRSRGTAGESWMPERLWLYPAPRALRHPRRPEASGLGGSAGLLLFHDPRQAHPSCARLRGGGGQVGSHAGAPNEDDARAAAILHDCTKYLGPGRAVVICVKNMVSYWTNWNKQAVKLLHSKTGRVPSPGMYTVCPTDVCEAICWHTTGKA